MAIAFDSESDGVANLSSLTVAHTVSGSNTLLVSLAYFNATGGGTTLGTPTYNGVSMTLGDTVASGSGEILGIHWLVAPATGTNNWVISNSGGGSLRSEAILVSYTGAKQTGQPDSTNHGADGGSDTFNASTTVVNNGSWMVVAYANRGGSFSSSSATTRGSLSALRVYLDSNGLLHPGLQNISISGSGGSGGTQEYVALSIIPDVPPAGAAPFKTLMGVGI